MLRGLGGIRWPIQASSEVAASPWFETLPARMREVRTLKQRVLVLLSDIVSIVLSVILQEQSYGLPACCTCSVQLASSGQHMANWTYCKLERWPQGSLMCILGGSPRESRRKIRRIRGIRRKRRIRRIRRRRRIRRTRRIRNIRRIRKKDEDKAVKRKLLV